MNTIKIPLHWSGEEAARVYDFLSEIMDAIWVCYEKPMVEIAIREFNETRE